MAGFALAMTALPATAQAEWLRADTPNLEVYSDAGRSALTGFTRKIETYDAFLHVLLGVPAAPPKSKLHVYLIASDDDMKTLWPTGVNIAGFYDSFGDEPMLVVRHNRVRQAITQGQTTSDADDTAFHEYTHYFQQANFPASYPGWVIEGYAQYLQTIRIEDDAIVLGHGSNSFAWRLKSAWLPWDRVLKGATGTLSRDEWNPFYGQAWLLTHYLSSDPARSVAFNRYLVAVAKGGDPVTSLTDALGVDLATLGRQLDRYYRATLSVQRIAWSPPAAPAATITALSPAEAATVLLDARTRYFVAEADRAAYVDRVRGLAARYPGDRFATLAAARVDAKYGDAVRAEATLAPLLTARPGDSDALLLRARARLRRADAEKDPAAAEALQKAARSDLRTAMAERPDDPALLYYLGFSRRTEPTYPTTQTIAILAKALEVRPQAQTTRLELGEALLKAKRRNDAMQVLQPLLNDPHDSYGKQASIKLVESYSK